MNNRSKAQIKIENVNGLDFIIKDTNGISIGRFNFMEIEEKNKFALLRVNFYKDDKALEAEYTKALEIVIESLYKNKGISKMSVIAKDDININIFSQLGFKLEGILYNSINNKKEQKSEIIFGLDYEEYKKIECINVFRLSGKRIELKVLTPEDTEEVLQYYLRNKDYLEPYEPEREDDYYTMEAQNRYLVEGYRQFLNNESVQFGIYLSKKLIGRIRISNIVLGVFKNAFIGYSIDEEYQGKGFMKEAVQVAMEFAFEDLGLHRIEASTLVDNIKSQNVLLANGFKKIGISEKYLHINGKWRDHVVFYKTSEA
ncbi:GNAT family N-acetyltransferase [Clostridium grantii]|uniref:Ribosomal-protein-alanine N-acetyltransferase n=1 Tax=Clostridium grantii DSM 8605 TaxID=1121316 RepID=A0A1M5Y538_9CLOT|nr:GNAT family protein [Clostridium grantii]SHI06928.1 ribosomal-protein-alanine N-acetyltransferase [Clostridium grantii DSM 8605]